MALAITVRYQFIDDKGKTSSTKVRVPNGFTLSQYVEFVQGMGQFIADISACQITSAGFSVGIDLAGLGLQALPATVADVAQKAYFAFRSAVGGFFKRLRIPTLSETKVNAGTDTLDTVDADVVAFVNAMTNGIVTTGGTIQPVTERGDDLTTLQEAREVFHKHN